MSDIQQPQPESDGGNLFTRKIGPLPGWAWIAVIALVAYLYLRHKSSSATQATATGTGTSTGTSNQLSSNLVGVSEPTPVLDGTYQVSVSPENAPNSIYANTTNSSTQGLGSNGSPAGNLDGTDTSGANANQTTQVAPQPGRP